MDRAGAEVVLDDVRFAYRDAAFAFDCRVPAGRIAAIMGPSGSGKSTLLSLVAGFEAPAAGRILIGGSDVTRVPPAQRPVSMLFQENNLFAHLTVADNVGLGLSPGLRLSDADRERVAAALARTGLDGKGGRLPAELSGGERQRAAIARVMVRDRPVLLLDEPFASLGPALRADMISLLLDLHAQRGMTVLFVTHQPEDAQRVAEDMIFVEAGRIAASGPAADFFGDGGPEAFRRYIGDRAARMA